jgi:hypothetical protein
MIANESVNSDNKYDEWILINNVFEKVGSWEVNLTDYIQKDDFNIITKEVSNLKEVIDSNKNETNTSLNNINETLNLI